MSNDLAVFADRFNALHDAQFEARLACYIELFGIEREAFAGRGGEFLAFCRDSLRMSRNVVFKRKRCILLYQGVTAHVSGAVLPMDFEKIDALTQIRSGSSEHAEFDIERICIFAADHDLESITTEEVRALVNELIGSKRGGGNPADNIKLPPPEQLLLAFENDAAYQKVSCDQALDCGCWFARHAVNKASRNPEKHTAFIKQAFLNLVELSDQLFALLPPDERDQIMKQESGE
jgi:hypothetical protein